MMNLFAARNRTRRRERGQSALAECAILLPMYVVLIFSCQTFGQMGLLKKKAILAARYTGFGGNSSDAEKMLLLDKWKEVTFGNQKVEVTLGSGSATIKYDPMEIMQEDTSVNGGGGGGTGGENALMVRGGLGKNLDLSDTYSVDK